MCDIVCCVCVCDAVCCDAVCCNAVCCCRYSVDVFQPPVQTCSERDASAMTASSTVVASSQPSGSDGEDSQSALGTGSGEPLSSQSSSLLSQDESLTTTFGGTSSFADTEATPTDNETASCANTSFSEVTVETSTNGDSSTATVGPCDIFGTNDNGGQSVLSATSSDVDTGYGSASTSVALGEGHSYVWQANGPGTDPRKGTEEERGKVPMSYVMGRQQDIDKCPPQFYLKPCDREGRNLSRPLGQRIEDLGKNAVTTRCMRE